MKIIAVGPGNSTEWFFNQKELKIPNGVKLLAFHRVFPFVEHSFDYWTWTDPDAAIDGLKSTKNIPKVIVPFWMKSISSQKKHGGTSSIHHQIDKSNFYDKSISALIKNSNINFIENCVSTKNLSPVDPVFNRPNLRFDEKVYFGTVPCDGTHSESNWAKENKFTKEILPICHYLGASEVYSIGFDNQGTGIKRVIPQFLNSQPLIDSAMQKYSLWINSFSKFHKMKIINLSSSNFTQLGKVMGYKTIEDLKWTK